MTLIFNQAITDPAAWESANRSLALLVWHKAEQRCDMIRNHECTAIARIQLHARGSAACLYAAIDSERYHLCVAHKPC